MTEDSIEDSGAEIFTEETTVSETLTELETEVVEEGSDGVAEVVEETTEAIIEESGFVTEVIEEKGEQGPPGRPAEDNFNIDLATIYLTAKL